MNEQTKQWFNTISSNDSLSSLDINELESHIEDSIDDLTNQGLSVDEANIVAIHRLGKQNEIEREFEKVATPARQYRKLLWLIAGAMLLTLFKAFASVLSNGILLLTNLHENIPSAMMAKELILAAVVIILCASFIWIILKKANSFSHFFNSLHSRTHLCFFLFGYTLIYIVCCNLDRFFYMKILSRATGKDFGFGLFIDVQLSLYAIILFIIGVVTLPRLLRKINPILD